MTAPPAPLTGRRCALLSATFHEPGHEHLIELVHQRDGAARRHLDGLELTVFEPAGGLCTRRTVDPREEMLDLAALLPEPPGGRAMVCFEAVYDARVFPYRPHHYAYLRRRGSPRPPLYYAVAAVLGGVPDRIGAAAINNFETYVFPRRPLSERYALLLGNLSRFSTAEAQVFTYYGPVRLARELRLGPKAHAEVPLAPEHEGRPLDRVEMKALFRLASYVVGRDAAGELVVFDHLFTYFK